jgi:hypothetical protein
MALNFNDVESFRGFRVIFPEMRFRVVPRVVSGDRTLTKNLLFIDETIYETIFSPRMYKYAEGAVANGLYNGIWFQFYENGAISFAGHRVIKSK